MTSPQTLLGQSAVPSIAKWRRLPTAIILMLLGIQAGCSRPPKPAEEVDWGQPAGRAARPTPSREPRPEPAASGEMAGSASEKLGRNDGAGSESGNGGDQNSGSDGQSAEPGEAQPPEKEIAVAAGEGERGPGGARDSPPPALPGRAPVKPLLSAAGAAESAKRILKQAQQLLRVGDASAAVEAAIEAYDQVLPHAQSDAECKKLCGQLEGFLTVAGRGRGRPDAVPTRFE
jgi:hypothetical protein